MGAAASIEALGNTSSFHPENSLHRRSDVHQVVESFVTERVENIARGDSLRNDRTEADVNRLADITVQPSIHSNMFSPLLGGIEMHSSSGLQGGKTSVSFILRRELNRRATTSSNSLNTSQMSLRVLAMRNQSRREMRYEKILNSEHHIQAPTMERLADYTEEMNEEDEEDDDEREELLGADDSFVKLGSRDALPLKAVASAIGDAEAKGAISDAVLQSPSAKDTAVGEGVSAVGIGTAADNTSNIEGIGAAAPAGAAKGGMGLQFKRPPPLKLAIQDDADWIQVSDDEAEVALSPRKKPPSLSLTHTLIKAADQSYMFTQSGTIFVNGFKAGIGIEGIQSTNSRRFSKKLKLPMKDRLVLLSQLGHGASGVVYKAFDLVEMKIVALKMISVFEQGKRRQMVRELTALFDVFRQKKKDFRKHQEGGKLVAAMSQLALLSGFKYNKHMDTTIAAAASTGAAAASASGVASNSNSSNNRVSTGSNKIIIGAPIVTGSGSGGSGGGAGVVSGDMRQKRKTFTVLESVSEQPDDADYLRSSSTPVIVSVSSATAANIEQLNKLITNIEKRDGDSNNSNNDAKSPERAQAKEYKDKAEGETADIVHIHAALSSMNSNISTQSNSSSSSSDSKGGQSSQKSPSKSEPYSSPSRTGPSVETNTRNSPVPVASAGAGAGSEPGGLLSAVASPKKDTITTGNEKKKYESEDKEVIMDADDVNSGSNSGGVGAIAVGPGSHRPGSSSSSSNNNTRNGNGIVSPRLKGNDVSNTISSSNRRDSGQNGVSVSTAVYNSPSKQTSDADNDTSAATAVKAAGAVGSTTADSKAGPSTDSIFRSPNSAREPQGDSPRGTVGSRSSPLPIPMSTPLPTPMPMPTLGTGVQRFLGRPASDYIVDFHDAFSNIEDGGVALMMEYMDGGSLQDIVDDGGCADEITLANIAVQALIGLAFLHSCGQLHRDLKPGNFLISHRGEVKVADLGILVQLEKMTGGDESVMSGANSEVHSTKNSDHGPGGGQGSNNSSNPGMVGTGRLSSNGSGNNNTMEAAQSLSHSQAHTQAHGGGNDIFEVKARAGTADSAVAVAVAPAKDDKEPSNKRCFSPFHVYKNATSPMPYTKTFVGTVTFMAPERIDGREYSYPSDVWAFGLSLLTVALGHLPIDTKGGYWTILHSVRDAEPPTLPDDGRFSDEFRDFISSCLQKDPAKRLSCNELLFHPFLNKAVPEECGIDDGEQDIDPVEAEAKGKVDLESLLVALHLHFERMKGNTTATLETMTTPRAGQPATDITTTSTSGPSEYKKGPTGAGAGAGTAMMKNHDLPLHPYFAGLREARNTEAFLKEFVMHHPLHNLGGDNDDGDVPAMNGKRSSLGERVESNGVSPSTNGVSSVSVPKITRELSDLARKRLAALGYQLHLPVEVLVSEAHKICVMIEAAALADPNCNDPNIMRIRLTSRATRNSSPKAFQNRIRRESK